MLSLIVASCAFAAPAGTGSTHLLSQQNDISNRYNAGFDNVMSSLAKLQAKANTLGENESYKAFNSAYEALKSRYDRSKSEHSSDNLSLTNSLRTLDMNDLMAKAHTLIEDERFIRLGNIQALSSEYDTNSQSISALATEYSKNLKALEEQALAENKKSRGKALNRQATTSTSVVLKSAPTTTINQDEVKKSSEQKLGAVVISGNPEVAKLVKTAEHFKSFSKKLQSNLNSINTLSSKDIIMANSGLNAGVRLAMLSNGGYPVEIAKSKVVEALAKERFASLDISQYTNRFDYVNNVYVSLLGGGGKINGIDSSPKVFGATIGGDTASDYTIYGGNISYLKSTLSSKFLDANLDNVGLSLYSRTFIENNELDFKVDFAIGKNKITSITDIANKSLKSNSKFDSKLLDLNLNYGRVYKVSEGALLKPYFGLGYNYNSSSTISMNGELRYEITGLSNHRVYGYTGMEYRKYFAEYSFLFVNPTLHLNIIDNYKKQDLKLNDDKFALERAKSAPFAYTLSAGIDIKVLKDLRTTLAVGYRGNKDSNFGTLTATFKYEF